MTKRYCTNIDDFVHFCPPLPYYCVTSCLRNYHTDKSSHSEDVSESYTVAYPPYSKQIGGGVGNQIELQVVHIPVPSELERRHMKFTILKTSPIPFHTHAKYHFLSNLKFSDQPSEPKSSDNRIYCRQYSSTYICTCCSTIYNNWAIKARAKSTACSPREIKLQISLLREGDPAKAIAVLSWA